MFRNRLPLSDLTAPLTDVLDHWRARGGEGLACPWPKFEMHFLPPRVLPTTLVIDVFDDVNANKYRFWGSKMTLIHGKDMTGRSPYELSPLNSPRICASNTWKSAKIAPPAPMFSASRSKAASTRHIPSCACRCRTTANRSATSSGSSGIPRKP